MKRTVLFIWLVLFFISGCPSPNRHFLKIETRPAGALVTVHQASDLNASGIRQVAGTTPLEKTFDFGKEGALWLEIEQRGYAPRVEKVSPETGELVADLKRIKDQNGNCIPAYAFPEIKRLFIAMPEIEIIERGFSREQISAVKSGVAREAIVSGIGNLFADQWAVINADAAVDGPILKPLWRDVRSAMELQDPIRLPYLAAPVFLETKSSLQAARQLGDKHGVDAILFISGRQNIETAGMKAGKVGITAVGTAASYAGGYSRAVSRGDSYFVYNIYTPSFAEGTLLKAALVDCGKGEILWLNKGLWGVFPFDEPEALEQILIDLLSGIERR